MSVKFNSILPKRSLSNFSLCFFLIFNLVSKLKILWNSCLIQTLIKTFFSKFKQAKSCDRRGPDASETSELLVKLVRVLANLSIHEEVGPLVARSSVFASLIEILGRYSYSARLLHGWVIVRESVG